MLFVFKKKNFRFKNNDYWIKNYFLPDISKAFLMAPLLSNFLTQIPLNGSLPLKRHINITIAIYICILFNK